MFKKSWIYGSLATVVLMGCTTQPRIAQTGCNPGGNCRVEITVAANCGFTITPDPLLVPEQGRRKRIDWDISHESNFVFRSDGIDIKQSGGEFVDQELDTGRKKFKWDDKHTRGGKYYYWIHVESASGGPLKCSIDPLIVNE